MRDIIKTNRTQYMKIINTGLFYFGTSGTAYHGKIILSQKEYDKAIKHIMSNRKINKYYSGAGDYAYIGKDLLQERIAQGKDNRFSFGVYVNDYIVALFKNTTRYHYKRQNYIIEIR